MTDTPPPAPARLGVPLPDSPGYWYVQALGDPEKWPVVLVVDHHGKLCRTSPMGPIPCEESDWVPVPTPQQVVFWKDQLSRIETLYS